MDRVLEQRQALQELRSLLGRFIRAEIDATFFIPTYGQLFAPFDPPDLTTEGLTDSERTELELFIRFKGGWFGEQDDLIPKRTDWEYGKSEQPYGWIDDQSYRKWISTAIRDAGIDF